MTARTSYDCMTADELELWQSRDGQTGYANKVPCFDCPAWFAAEARERGCCNRWIPGSRPRLVTDDPVVLARRIAWRERKRRQVAAKRAGATP